MGTGSGSANEAVAQREISRSGEQQWSIADSDRYRGVEEERRPERFHVKKVERPSDPKGLHNGNDDARRLSSPNCSGKSSSEAARVGLKDERPHMGIPQTPDAAVDAAVRHHQHQGSAGASPSVRPPRAAVDAIRRTDEFPVTADDALSIAVEHAREYLASSATRPVAPTVAYDGLLPTGGVVPEVAITELIDGSSGGLLAHVSGRFFGYVAGATLPAALAADWLVSTWDQNTALASATPAVAAVDALPTTRRSTHPGSASQPNNRSLDRTSSQSSSA